MHVGGQRMERSRGCLAGNGVTGAGRALRTLRVLRLVYPIIRAQRVIYCTFPTPHHGLSHGRNARVAVSPAARRVGSFAALSDARQSDAFGWPIDP